MKVIGKGTYSGHQKHWSQGTNPCYLTEWVISKCGITVVHPGCLAERRGRKKVPGGDQWECRGSETQNRPQSQDTEAVVGDPTAPWTCSYKGLYILIQLFLTPWTAACQASPSITNSWSPPKHMSVESVMPSISSSVVPFSSCSQSFPASGSFEMSQLFASRGQSIGVSASTSVLPMNTQDWSPLGWTGLTSLQSKELSRVFSNTTVQRYWFFSTQLWSNYHIHIWLLEKP